MALTLDAGRDQRRPVCGGTGVPEGEIGDQVARELRDFFFLGHEELAVRPALPQFGEGRLEHLAKESSQWHAEFVGLNDRLVCRGLVAVERLTKERLSQCRRSRQAVQVQESLPDLVERQSLRLPRLDLSDTLHVVPRKEPMTTSRPGWGDQALALQEAQAGVGDIGVGAPQLPDDLADR